MKKWALQKNQKNIFFRKKKCIYFFLNFLFFDIFSHFSGNKKKWKFLCFFLQVKFTWCLWTKILTWKLGHLWWKCFWSFLQTIATTEMFFYFFWDSCPCSGSIWKKTKWKFEKKFQKCSTFEISFVALRPKFRPKIPSKIFFCPKFLPKQFWVKSDHYIIKISKKFSSPQKWPF